MKLRLIASAAAAALLATSNPGFADGLRFKADLSGAQESPSVDSTGTAEIRVRFDESLTRVFVDLRVRDLIGGFTRSHFHCARPGVSGPIAFGLVQPGPLTFDGQHVRGYLTNADFNGADCVPLVGRPVNNIAALAFAMRDGLVYVNVHTDAFPAGEIRGQLVPDEDQRDHDDHGDRHDRD